MAHGSHHRSSAVTRISPVGFVDQRRTPTIRAIWFHQAAPSRTLDGTTRCEHERNSRLLAALTFFPVHCGPELRIEQFRIQLNVGTNLRVLFGCHNHAIEREDHFRRYPATAKFLILVELSLL